MSTAVSGAQDITREPVMSIVNGDDIPIAVAENEPVLLVRYRSGVVGEASRAVHVVTPPPGGLTGVVSARCGAVLICADLEVVAPGAGMPCTACVLHCVMNATLAETPPDSGPDRGPITGPGSTGAIYQQWGWPVTLYGGQVCLSLERAGSALMIPIPLGAEVVSVLIQRRCAPPVLAHPDAPGHHIVLTGEKYGLQLPWPEQIHQVTGVLLLPPTRTSRGPITWITTPQPDSLRLCREIDLFAARRCTVGGEPPRESGR